MLTASVLNAASDRDYLLMKHQAKNSHGDQAHASAIHHANRAFAAEALYQVWIVNQKCPPFIGSDDHYDAPDLETDAQPKRQNHLTHKRERGCVA